MISWIIWKQYIAWVESALKCARSLFVFHSKVLRMLHANVYLLRNMRMMTMLCANAVFFRKSFLWTIGFSVDFCEFRSKCSVFMRINWHSLRLVSPTLFVHSEIIILSTIGGELKKHLTSSCHVALHLFIIKYDGKKTNKPPGITGHNADIVRPSDMM